MVFLLNKLSNNYTQVGLLYSLHFLMRTLLEIPSGVIADALGRKKSMLFSYLLYISSFITYYLSNSYFLLIIATILFGIADAFRTGTHKAMIVEYLSIKGWGEHKTAYYGLTRSWSQTGSAASSIIVLFIYMLKPDYSFIFLVTTIPYILGIINLYTYPDYLDSHIKQNTEKHYAKLRSSLKESFIIVSDIRNLKILAGSSLFFGYYHAVKDYLQPIVLSIGIIVPINMFNTLSDDTSKILPLIYFVIYLLTALASRKAGQLKSLLKKDTISIKYLSILGGICGLLVALFYYLNWPILSLIPFMLVFSLINLQRPSVVSYVSEQFQKKNMASVLSIESQLGSLIAAILAFITGFFADIFGLAITFGIISFVFVLLSTLKWFPDNENNFKRDIE
jgi:MFS family permease